MKLNASDEVFAIHPLLQRLARSNILVILLVYISFSILNIYIALKHHSFLEVVLLFITGIIIWSWVEYMMHRFVFHHSLHNENLKKFRYFMHGHHHVNPNDYQRLMLPLILTLPLTLLLYVLFKSIFSIYAEALFAGFIAGYVWYDTTHYVIHRFNYKTPIGRFLKYYHFHHHFKDNNKCFGVTNPFWDYIFRTAR